MALSVKSRSAAWLAAVFVGWLSCSLVFIFVDYQANARLDEVLFYSQMFSILALIHIQVPTLFGVAYTSYRLRTRKLSFHLTVAFALLIFFTTVIILSYGGTASGVVEMGASKEGLMFSGPTLFATFVYWKLTKSFALRPDK